jgi:hypothetical protein
MLAEVAIVGGRCMGAREAAVRTVTGSHHFLDRLTSQPIGS